MMTRLNRADRITGVVALVASFFFYPRSAHTLCLVWAPLTVMVACVGSLFWRARMPRIIREMEAEDDL